MRALAALVLVAALAHAVAEMIIVWTSGAELGWLDPVIVLTSALVLNSVWIGLAGAAALAVFGRQRLALWTGRRAVLNRAFVAAVCAAYLAGSLVVLRHLLTAPVGATAVAVIVVLSGTMLTTAWPRLVSAAVAAVALLGFALASIGAVGWAILAMEASPLAADSPHVRLVSCAQMCLPSVVVAMLLLRPPRALERWSLRRSTAALGFVLVLGVAATAVLDAMKSAAQVSWHTSEPRQDARARPNVVLVVLDTVAASHMELFGHPGAPTMPALTEFARRDCDVVTSVMAPAPWTPATHASIFSGTWPHVHGCRRPTPREVQGKQVTDPYYCMDMRRDLPTLAEWLSEQGYSCGAVVANTVLNFYGLPRGFDHFDARSPKYVSWTRRLIVHIPGSSRALMRMPVRLRAGLALFDPLAQEWRGADQVSRDALEWVSDHDSGPYFLFVNYLDAHTPYRPESASARLSRLPDEYLELSNRLWEEYAARAEPIPGDLVRGLSSLYDESLRELDSSVARFLDVLMTEPSFDDTLLIITADHGEEFMEHGHLEHSTDVYEPQVRTPMLVRLPTAMRATPPEVGSHFQQVDLFATIASLVGGGELPETDGRPWGVGRDWAMSEVFENPGFSPRYRLGYCAVEMDSSKYVRRSDGGEELYDLELDPGETRSVLGARPELFAACRRLVDERDAHLMRGGRPPAGPSAGDRLDQLKALGYVQ